MKQQFAAYLTLLTVLALKTSSKFYTEVQQSQLHGAGFDFNTHNICINDSFFINTELTHNKSPFI